MKHSILLFTLIFYSLASTKLYAQESIDSFIQTLSISSGELDTVLIAFGQNELASADFDLGIDVPIPPFPPSGFDARILSSETGLITDLIKDVRSISASQEFRVFLRPSNETGEVSISWSSIDALEGTLILDIDGQQEDITVDGSVNLSLDINEDVVGIVRYSSISGVDIEDYDTIPTRVSLDQNYPNPFNPVTKIRYSLPEQLHVRIEILDLLGRVIDTVVDEQKGVGFHEVEWNALDATSGSYGNGVYFLVLRAGTQIRNRSMVLIK